MNKINKIFKKSLILFIVFATLISYSYPAIVFGNNGWTYDFDADRGGDYKDYNYDDIPTNDPTLNEVIGWIVRDGVIMQAYAINELLNDGELTYTYTYNMPNTSPMNPNTSVEATGWFLKTKDGSEDVDEIIKLIQDKIDKMNEGSTVVRDYAKSYLSVHIEELKAIIDKETSIIKFEAAQNFAIDKQDDIDKDFGKGGNSASDVADKMEEDRNQTSEGNNSDGGKDEADGGILLEPLFALVNFVADSLTNILGQLMLPDHQDGFEWTSDIKDFQPENLASLEPKDVYRLNTGSFVNLLGTHYYRINYSPEKIFSGEIELLSIDFISGKNAAGEEIDGDWASIRVVISQWYKVLRMIAIIGLLSVLIYTGIKIIISANAKDKAKYKEWIINWFVAVAILFCMHYIMSFVISVTNEISQLISSASGEIIVEAGKEFDDNTVNTNNVFATNLMGVVRFMVQADNGAKKIGYEVMYIALLFYTIKFTFIYLKRVLNMAFLTLIAPIVALTYPIDKINDGNAQGFNMWLKEYIFNALLQPMHLILYYILVGSAVSIAASNPLYAIVVLMFLTEAEKLLKKIFGFDKAGGGTVGGMAGAFAAGAIASNIKNIAKLAGGKGGNAGKGGSGENNNEIFDNPKPTQGLDVDKFGGAQSQPELTEAPQTGGASAAVAHQNSNNPVADAEKERLNEQLADGQITEAELTDEQRVLLGKPRTTPSSSAQTEKNNVPEPTPVPESTQVTDKGIPMGQMATNKDKNKNKEKKKSKFAKGIANVSKTLAKPVWDFNHGAAYNSKRLLRKVGKAALGAGVGITAAAVQAGISITDGKYNPMEGMATFAAGYAGGGQIADGIGNLANAYTQGALDGDKGAIMKRAQEKWADREDVIAFNKANYKPEEREDMARVQSKYLLPYGFNLKEMKAVTKYAKVLEGKGVSEEQAYKQAANTLKLRQEVQDKSSKAIYNSSERDKYIETMLGDKTGAERERLKKAYENGFKAIIAYDDAQS